MLVRGHVRNGRLIVDEPTDLPEGEEIELAPVGWDDEVTPEDEAAIEESMAQVDRGEFSSAEEVFARIRESIRARSR